jgi:hypothetical protein
MVAACPDPNDQIERNKLNLSPVNVTDPKGRYVLSQIDAVTEQVAQSILNDAETNPLSKAVNLYGNDLNLSSDYLNGLLRQRIGSLDSYPDLQGRWERGNISQLETADFIQRYNYTPQGLMNENDYQRLARNLDSYYKNDFSTSLLGGFCDRFDSLFSSIDAFFDLIGVVDGLITDALAIADKISRGYDGIKDLTVQEIIDKLIEEIKKKVEAVINQVFAEVQDMVDNFDPAAITEGFETFVDAKVVKGIMTVREQTCAFFTEENKKGIKDKIGGLIDYAKSLFESPGIEEIQFLIARICALAANVEALVRDINKPLNDYTNRYSTIVNRLQTISRINESSAIKAGAIRYSPTTRQEVINRLEGQWTATGGDVITNTGEDPQNIPPITAADYRDLPRCGNVFAGNDTDIGLGPDGSVNHFDAKEGVGIYGYTRVDLDVKVYLKRLRLLTGSKLIITNGYVSKAYNTKQKWAEDNSHLSGMVVDIKKDMANVPKFLEDAFKVGFKYIKEYDDFIHLDLREIL